MKIKKIMLISPRYTLYKSDVRRCLPPIGLTYLAAALEKAGYIVNIVDAANEDYYNTEESGDFITYGLESSEIRKRIVDFMPDVVGVSCIFSTQHQNAKDVLELVKEIDSRIITLIGGSHPTYTAEETLDSNFLDYLILGEGEFSTVQLLNALNKNEDVANIDGLGYKKDGGNVIHRNSQYMKDIDAIPYPALHLLNMENYFKINLPQNPYPLGKRVVQVITSRGCCCRCVFCTTTNFWGNRYRVRSAQNVIGEIRELKETYNIDEVQFTDDNLTLIKSRAMEIFESIKGFDLKWCQPQGVAVWTLDNELLEKMKESGCYQLTFAIESGNQEVLNKIVKKPLKLEKIKPLVEKAKELGIKVHGFFVCGLPGETIAQMHETFEFARGVGFDSASFFLATPLVGSELLEICKKKGYLRENMSCNEQLYKIGNINTPEFKAEEVQKLVEVFNRDFNKYEKRMKKFEVNKY